MRDSRRNDQGERAGHQATFTFIAHSPPKAQYQVVEAVESLCDEPFKGEQLAAEWKGLRRLGVGRYRVIYAYDGRQFLILVVRVGHRKEVYRQG